MSKTNACVSRRFSVLTLTLTAGAYLAALTPSLQAGQFQLTYTGVFNSQNALNPASDATPTYFAGPTAFTIKALFDTSTPNLAPPSPPLPPPFAGFRAYAASEAWITIGGATYSMETYADNPKTGVTVAIFDQNSFYPGRYGIGILQDPPADGSGIIGDFAGALPNFSAANIVPTVFTDYYGVGYGSGPCLSGTPPACPHDVTPFILHDASMNTYKLTLGNFEEDYPQVHNPNSSNIVGPLNTAVIAGIPEPGTFAISACGLLALAGLIRKRR